MTHIQDLIARRDALLTELVRIDEELQRFTDQTDIDWLVEQSFRGLTP